MDNSIIEKLLENNKEWVQQKLSVDPNFFSRLSKQQNPQVLWIGCADSRVPANEITGTDPGEIFVHRNIANMVVHTDLNMLSVVQYAVQVLKVKHIIVCGHYGCGGVIAAMGNQTNGLVDRWLTNIKEVYNKHAAELEEISDLKKRSNRLVELNVMEQVKNLAKTNIIQEAWQNQALKLHGWVYGLETGRLKDLNCMISEIEDLEPIFRYNLNEEIANK